MYKTYRDLGFSNTATWRCLNNYYNVENIQYLAILPAFCEKMVFVRNIVHMVAKTTSSATRITIESMKAARGERFLNFITVFTYTVDVCLCTHTDISSTRFEP